MLVRAATSADIPCMMRLEQRSVTASHWSQEQYDRLFAAVSPRRISLVIEEQDGVRGFLIALAAAPEWEIENIAVAADARRRGLGTRLLGEFLAHARAEGAQAIYLEVRESNHPARAFYEKMAFIESGRRIRYYQNPQEDAIAYRHLFT
jgi:ribosomal-protein-alanine N-acetyltransferase